MEKADGIMKRECEVSTVQKIRKGTTVEKTKVNFNEVTETAEFYSGEKAGRVLKEVKGHNKFLTSHSTPGAPK